MVEVTNPADGSYVSGTLLVTAEATDNKEVDSIEIYIDSSLVVGFAKSYAYYFWNTETLTLLHNSIHRITALGCSENIGYAATIEVIIQHFGGLEWRYRYEYAYGTDTNIAKMNSSPAIGFNRTIYFCATGESPPFPSPGVLFALNPVGTLKWGCTIFDDFQSSPVIGWDGTIYTQTTSGSSGYCFLKAISSDGILKWSYTIGRGGYVETAIANDGTIYVAGFVDSNLHAVNSDGTLKWCYETDGRIISSPAIGSDDGFMYAVYGSAPLANSPLPKFRHDLKNTGRVGAN